MAKFLCITLALCAVASATPVFEPAVAGLGGVVGLAGNHAHKGPNAVHKIARRNAEVDVNVQVAPAAPAPEAAAAPVAAPAKKAGPLTGLLNIGEEFANTVTDLTAGMAKQTIGAGFGIGKGVVGIGGAGLDAGGKAAKGGLEFTGDVARGGLGIARGLFANTIGRLGRPAAAPAAAPAADVTVNVAAAAPAPAPAA